MTIKEVKSFLEGFFSEKVLLENILASSEVREVEKGEILIDIGEEIQFTPILIEGSIKIVREDQEEKEYLLYFLEAGNTCAMSLGTTFCAVQSTIRAIADTDATILMIPAIKTEEWLAFQEWRNFIFNSYSFRINEFFDIIDTLTLKKMDERIFLYLEEKSKIQKTKNIEVTHAEIASDLSTSRVVISRILKVLEKEGKINLNRNNITLC